MTRVLRKKMAELARGEDGVVLVVTLALFMLMYVSCAGVFAVGQAVKEKVVLQNAVDAAAYSAAVVQADALSRIATINRAMAWTYKDMVCRQMDYVTRKWLEKTEERYRANEGDAEWIRAKLVAADKTVLLNGLVEGIGNVRSALAGSSEDLEGSIDRDRERLDMMNKAVLVLVYGDGEDRPGLVDRMRNAARDALEANLPGEIGDRCLFKVKLPDNGLFQTLANDAEARFLALADLTDGEFRSWFPVDGSTSDSGISRSYAGPIKSEWVWSQKGTHIQFDEEIDAGDYGDGYYVGTAARPLEVDRKFFDDDGIARGAVSVGVAKLNSNPWEGLVDAQSVVNGLYAAFTYSDATKWTWAVSSAQAGHRDRGAGHGYDYSTTWDDGDQAWNLGTDDWDAVFTPVRRAFDTDGFAEFITDKSEWKRLSSEPSLVIADDAYNPLKLAALPRMHNGGGAENRLRFDADDFLDLMYH